MTKARNPKQSRITPERGVLRIIGGQWRSRKLTFTGAPGLRPTSDRVRETLFNWLTPDLPGARCVDLFAGSGALGLEALSRGAQHCDFVEPHRESRQQIQAHLATLDATARGRCHAGAAADFLERSNQAIDIAFIDPPFDLPLLEPTCTQLQQFNALAPGALIYIESPARAQLPTLPWDLHREKRAGGVTYRLYRHSDN